MTADEVEASVADQQQTAAATNATTTAADAGSKPLLTLPSESSSGPSPPSRVSPGQRPDSQETERLLADLMLELDNATDAPPDAAMPAPTVETIVEEQPYVPHPAIEGPPPPTDAENDVMRFISQL